MKLTRGMTLVELMVVLALLGILTALAAGGIGPLSARFSTRQGTEAAAHALAVAQALARATGRCHRLETFSAGAAVAAGTPGDALVLKALPDADCETGVAWATVDTFPMPTSIPVVIDNAVGPNPVLRPNGRPKATAGALIRVNPVANNGQVVLTSAGAICITDTGVCP